jgi:hydroxymethylbilane synthase
MPLKIGTRGSRLALAQAQKVAGMLNGRGIGTEIVVLNTQGDRVTDVPLHEIGGQGVFVRALDEAILDGKIDAAVHSMKDIPSKRPAGLVLSAVLTRDSPADFLVHRKPIDRVHLVGTSSTRRKAQLLRHDPGVEVSDLRGNVDTRLRKLDEGLYDAIVLAEAGLQRLGLFVSGTRLPPEVFVPSPNQGTIAVVGRDTPAVIGKLSLLDDPTSRKDILIERAVMEELGGGCFTPMGIYCSQGHLIVEVLSVDGRRGERFGHEATDIGGARIFAREIKPEIEPLISEAYAALRLDTEGA